jgi:hypothetical protein
MARNVVTAVDSADFFVQARDIAAALINVVATATGTQNSPDQVNTLHKGVVLFAVITSMGGEAHGFRGRRV